MGKKLVLLGGGVVVALVAAVFAGAAAATTGAPVFYDARLPQPAPSVSAGGFEVSEGAAPEAQADRAPGSNDVGSGDVVAPDAGDQPTPPDTPPPTDPPTSTDDAAPTPDPDDPSADHPAPGGPDSVVPMPDGTMPPPAPEKRKAWLAFQQVVRDCMAGAGQEYLYWEWWNPKSGQSNRFPPIPADLTPDEHAAWTFALHGDSPGGDAYDWERAGCWGYAVHTTGGTN